MVLYDPKRTPEVAPEDALLVVHAFLRRCRQWAEREIPRRVERVVHDHSADAAARLHGWLTYIEFTDHTLKELESGRLDHWFADNGNDAE